MSVIKTEVAVGEWANRANLTYVPCNEKVNGYGYVDATGRKVAVGGGGDITRRPYLVDTGETVTYIKYDTGVSPIFKVTEETDSNGGDDAGEGGGETGGEDPVDDPYGTGLLYSIFVNGGGAWSAEEEGIVTTDNYTANVETVDGITARRFNGAEKVTTTAGRSRNVWSYSVWLKLERTGWSTNGGYPIGRDGGLAGITLGDDGHAIDMMPPTGNLVMSFVADSSSNVTQKWHHYVVTYDGLRFGFYWDKRESITPPVSGNFVLFPSTSGLTFGQRSAADTTSDTYFDGYIANFRLYGHVLTAEEIGALYDELMPVNS